MKTQGWRSLSVQIAICLPALTLANPSRAAQPITRAPLVALVGIVNDPNAKTDSKSTDSFLKLLQASVVEQPGIALVDREDRDKVLKELSLTIDAIGDQTAPLRIGKLLDADIIVWAQPAFETVHFPNLQPATSPEPLQR
ncbi:MAG: hypothetical protein ABSB74_14585 [Tepidisphaeraceae bacterium]